MNEVNFRLVRIKNLMDILCLNEMLDYLAMGRPFGSLMECGEERGWSCLEKEVRLCG